VHLDEDVSAMMKMMGARVGGIIGVGNTWLRLRQGSEYFTSRIFFPGPSKS